MPSSTSSSHQPVIGVIPVSAISLGAHDCDESLTYLLRRASGCLNLQPAALQLQCQGLNLLIRPKVLKHSIPKHRVQLLGLPPACSSSNQQPSRSQLYTVAVLQHAALLLLLLVSDGLLLLTPAASVPASVLQALHVLTRVKQQLLQQLQALQRQMKLQQKLAQQQDDSRQQGQIAASEDGDGVKHFERLLQLLQHKLPTQLHVVLQIQSGDATGHPAAAVAAAAAQQAELVLLKCKAATASAAAQHSSSSGRPVSGSTSSSLLFELAGVHCCSADSGLGKPARKVILNAILGQLAKADQPAAAAVPRQQQQQQQQAGTAQQQAGTAQQQQQLSSLPQIVATVAAAAAAGQAYTAAAGPVTEQDLQQLWQQLLQLLFPAVCGSTSSSISTSTTATAAGRPYPLQSQAVLDLNDVMEGVTTGADDITDGSEDDGSSWDGSEGWQEVSHSSDAAAGAAEEDGAAAAGQLLAAAVDPLYPQSAQRCLAAARSALAHYLKVVPQRYSRSMHDIATSRALALYAAAAGGPAQPELQSQLTACCAAAWHDGRQQCSYISLTGRQCMLAPHDASEVPHDSGMLLHLAAPDGSSSTEQQDWFDLSDANNKPALQLLLQQQLKREKQLGKLHDIEVKLLPPQQQQQQQQDLVQHQQAPAGSSSSSMKPVLVGPWLSEWDLGSGDAAEAAGAAAAAGLQGQGWLPGLNKLLQLKLLAPRSEDDTPAAAAGDSGIDAPGTSAARGKGPAAAAAAGKGSWGQGRPQRGGRQGQQGKQAAAAAAATAVVAAPIVELGPEDFPTLAEAVMGTRRAPASAPAVVAAGAAAGVAMSGSSNKAVQSTVAQLGSTKHLANAAAGIKQQEAAKAADTAQQQLQQLLDAWGRLGQPQQQHDAGMRQPGSLHAPVAAMPALDGRGDSSVRGGGGRGRGRRSQGQQDASAAAAAAAARADKAAAEEADNVLATVWIGLEYESLSGHRAILQPAQVLKTLQLEQQQRAAAAAAASSAVRHLPAERQQQQQQHRRGGERGQSTRKQQQQGGSSAMPGGAANAAAPEQQASGVEQLLLQDIPLFLEASAAGGAAAAAVAGKASPDNSSSSSSVLPVDPTLLQLQRIYVRTPPAPLVLASQPRISFTAAAADGSAAAAGNSGTATGTSSSSSSSSYHRPTSASSIAASALSPTPGAGAVAGAAADASISSRNSAALEFSCSSEVVLPPDSLLVLNLPKMYAAPSSWVQLVHPAAAAAVSAAAEQIGDQDKSIGSKSGDGTVVADVSSNAVQAAAGSSSSSVKGALGSTAPQQTDHLHGCSREEEPLLPLIPAVLADTAGSSSSRSDAVCCWSAWLRAGSWLYPAAVQPQQPGQK